MSDHLIIATANGETEKVLTLLQEGADINATNQLGRTAVLAATYYNQVETVRALIQCGADINLQDNQLNVLLHAGASGFLEIVKLAIAAGADTKLTNRFGGVAIIPAAERGHVEVVRALLNHSDIDVNHINHLHWTALMEAVILGNGGERHQEIVQLLVDYGANLNITDREGFTPLQHAKQLGFHKIELILKEAESEGFSKS
ncbi:ankyrin repeat domain-containing protein [Lysinibacillus fusiformis]|uniref:ankyrin repeat domain-containing protein n=1 Tax=Lysinibacillus fusiformis TaxID=28031 RepID=UPI003557D4E6